MTANVNTPDPRIEPVRFPPEYMVFDLDFSDGPPRIDNRNDALMLLDCLINADTITCEDRALEALRDAIAGGVV